MKKNAPDSFNSSFFLSEVDVPASSLRILTTSDFSSVASKPRKASIKACLISPFLYASVCLIKSGKLFAQ